LNIASTRNYNYLVMMLQKREGGRKEGRKGGEEGR
jgi:hypothetical protein